MNIEKILNLIYKALPEDIKRNPSFIKLMEIYISLCKNLEVRDISIRKDIIKESPELLNYNGISKLAESTETLFAMYTRINEFSLSITNIPVIVLTSITELEDGVTNTVEIEVTINENTTLWRTADYHKNKNDYYFNYDINMHLYNKDGDEIKIENLNQELDEDFSATFGIPMELANECRLNFDKYIDYINDTKARITMEGNDEINNSVFISPFKINELGGVLLGYDDEEEQELEENEEETYDEEEFEENTYLDESLETDEFLSETQIEEMENLKNQLITHMGTEGDFVMSLNLFDNITDYVIGKVNVLETSGRFIRKLNGSYTIFYIHLNENGLIVFPKQANTEEIKSIYEEDPQNDYTEGLKEFFGINKTKKLEK